MAQISELVVGTRVRLTQTASVWNWGITVPAGSTGVVASNDGEMASVKMDETFACLAEFDDELQITDDGEVDATIIEIIG